jgi:hypothetical protein
MQGKLSLTQIGKYSSEFTASISSAFFRNQSRISGSEILKLTPIHQANLFVIRELMLIWEAEKSKLESPYFDYSDKAVQEALIVFQNTLSNHISINKMDFETLLEKAVYDTLLLILSPYDYYADLLDTQGKGKIKISNLKTGVRYMRINRAPMEKLVSEIEATSTIPFISSKEAFSMLDKILDSTRFQPEATENTLQQFASIWPIESNLFFEVDQTIAPIIQNPKNQNLSDKPGDLLQNKLFDEAEHDNRPTIANNFLKQKIESLKENLSINQKFMFTKALFKGNTELFVATINRLDQFKSLDEAFEFINNQYPEWDKDSEEYTEFQLLLEKRFLKN